MGDAKPVECFFSRSTSKHSSLISKNLAELDSGLLPEGIHQMGSVQEKKNLIENVVNLK